MNIVTISASMRASSQSLKVSNWLQTYAKNNLQIDSKVLDLHELALPMYTDDKEEAPSIQVLLSALELADGVIFVSPEWNGMMSHGLINMQHYLGTELANKPVMLVGVSSGRGGSYPVMQMRTMGYKNNHYVISSENLVLQGVKDLFNDNNMDEESPDINMKKRADYALRVLVEYAKALKTVRNSGVIDLEKFGNGL